MTMAEVLEGIRGLGKRFDRTYQAASKRLETGNRDGLGARPRRRQRRKSKAKKAEAEALADPDDDDDKDRGRSTRTPGVQPMTRAQIHRAAKEKDKLARTGKYGNIGINPNPGPSRNKAGDAWYDSGKYAAGPPSLAGVTRKVSGSWRYLEENGTYKLWQGSPRGALGFSR